MSAACTPRNGGRSSRQPESLRATLTAEAAIPPTTTYTPTPTETPQPTGWVFSNVRLTPDQAGENLLLYGDVLNSTGAVQELAYITGIFFDAPGQMIADSDRVFDYWPIDVVPPGSQVPFELMVEGIQNAANFDLMVEAEPSSETLRQDFEFLDANAWNEAGEYCVDGRLRNPGNPLVNDLVIAVILYDHQDKVVNYGEYYEPFPEDIIGDQTLDFEVCADPSNQEVARHELRAWGG